ncbi:iron ABC transporter permease [Corynebacterium diphtheriae subsp. lausannense]|nr:iron ABC transporter permease [Corynebacterium diphtheriae subsp. lausannense]
MLFRSCFVGSSSKSPGVVDINPTVTALCAFVGALASVAVIALLARQRAATPSVIILAGVALSSLFTSGTSLIQYFADELQIAAIVFWAFDDLGRARWPHLGVMTVVIVLALAFFVWKIWSYNALDAGEDVAQALGVNVIRLRTWTLIIGAAATAMVVSVVGVIAFVGLIALHIVRRLVGEDYRYVLPGSALAGALVLLLADTFSRLIIAPTVLPVGAVTSFLGAPLFLMIILRQLRRKP